RPAILLWLASLGEDRWVALDDLAAHLQTTNPEWDRLDFPDEPEVGGPAGRRPTSTRGRSGAAAPRGERGRRLLGSLLLGAGYVSGLVRAAEGKEDGRTVVQLTPLGKYVLATGPPPPPRPAFEHFLFVQPNLEVIAYRQGLTAQLVGRLSRFAWWTKI